MTIDETAVIDYDSSIIQGGRNTMDTLHAIMALLDRITSEAELERIYAFIKKIHRRKGKKQFGDQDAL